MKKANRRIALMLVVLLLCGMATAAHADVVTLGVSFCGKVTAEDGTTQTVELEGKFRVTQNGEEAGIITAGKTTVTLNGTERIRIEPLPESIAPEWDLSGIARDVYPEAGGTMTVTIEAEPLKVELPTPEPTAEPTAEPKQVPENPETPDEPEITEPEPEPEPETEPDAEPEQAEDEEEVYEPSGPVVTPTMPPYDLSMLAPTPEPEWTTLREGSGSVRVFAYYDQNNNGWPGEGESGVAGVTVCLFTDGEEAVAAQETGSDGFAVFENLPEGAYRIKAILPDGWKFNKTASGEDYAGVIGDSYEGEGMSDAFSVTAGGTATPGISLGRCLHVSGVCWFENMNIDGLYEDGEMVLPGVLIELDGEKNGLHYETMSGEDGSWRIERVAPAAYQMTVHAPDGMMFTRVPSHYGRKTVIARDGVGTASRRVDLNNGESKEAQYIGFTWSGEIRGICFQDANYNGMYDEGEPPMPGVKVTATKQFHEDEAAVTFSGEDGTYVLTGLRANTYTIRAVLPDDGCNFTKVVSDPLGNHFEARSGRRENFWKNFVLETAERREVNVGAIYPATVTGTVYLDDDFSGIMNGNEKIVTSYVVKLFDMAGNLAAMDKTSVKGKYELTNVPPGDYTLSVTALKDYAFTRLGEGNVILNRTNGEGYSEVFHLDLKETKTGMDIGMIRPGKVTGSVFADQNDNGVRDAGENGLPGVTVRLMGEEGEAFSAEIGADGAYLFDAVMPGTYYLEYTLPDNAVFARVTAGGNTVTGEKSGRSGEFSMSSGISVEGPVCGALTLGRLEGSAYQDHDGDGVRSGEEDPMAGLTVTLTPSRADHDEVTAITGEDGTFLLEDLRPDDYTLTVTCPENYVLSRTDNLHLPLAPGKTQQSAGMAVRMGEEWTDQQLGTVIPAALSGQMWLDENNNGLFDPEESTPAGYEITVTDDRTGKVFDTLRTDSEGRFATSGMIPGSFTFSFPLNEQTIAPKDGNSDFREEGGNLVLKGLILSEEEQRDGLLLGIVRYTNIGGTVWIDRGGTMEPLSGARISLLDKEGTELKTLVTAESGNYRFDKLMPGTYVLEAEMPEGCVVIEPGDRRLDGTRISVLTDTLNRTGTSNPIDLKMAEDQMKLDIGCVLPGRVGDLCWLDLDGDGLQGMDEPGVPGVKITLLRDGQEIAQTVSDQYGFYRFSDLYPAVYTLQVAPPGQVKPTKQRTDIPMIASSLLETDASVCETAEFPVESDKANYNVDLGFVCRQNGVLPAGVGEGKKQTWNSSADDN